ncbi:guanitoxin biosynthesis L-enduracididine beta-hydroxylase GntD [Nonomuraea jabiensis]|uniref:guanitoxin biosynthesis L-enduracididine beta-hydroxylase GntD n=1 Tax=Nonomuraea jabiensis TaxID=882448 RepID=UPI00342B2C55
MASATDRLSAISPDAAQEVEELTLRLAKRYDGPENEELLRELPVVAAGLPAAQRRFLRGFALGDSLGYCVVRGHTIDQTRIGPTPGHWRGRPRPGPEFAEEILLLLYASLLGEPFAWKTQQDGRLVHDVFPIKGYETEQLGVGSTDLLTLHTEDAFHPWRADFLLLGCLRNPRMVATIVAELDVRLLDPAHARTLHQPRFLIRPDDSHLAEHNAPSDAYGENFAEIAEMKRDDNRVAVLWGDPGCPYLRVDPYFMEVPEGDEEAAAALEAVSRLMERKAEDVVLRPGDILFINNHRLAHGRRPFTASYDGTDRWLKRVSVTTDFRKSRERRGTATARFI